MKPMEIECRDCANRKGGDNYCLCKINPRKPDGTGFKTGFHMGRTVREYHGNAWWGVCCSPVLNRRARFRAWWKWGVTMKAPLAPHKEQEGFVYARLKKERGYLAHALAPVIDLWPLWRRFKYSDDQPRQRIISSRRVEEAVETADYLKRCADEGLMAIFHAKDGEPYLWSVRNDDVPNPFRFGATLREAYWRYKTSVERAAE